MLVAWLATIGWNQSTAFESGMLTLKFWAPTVHGQAHPFEVEAPTGFGAAELHAACQAGLK